MKPDFNAEMQRAQKGAERPALRRGRAESLSEVILKTAAQSAPELKEEIVFLWQEIEGLKRQLARQTAARQG
jgi:hypothetical protein